MSQSKAISQAYKVLDLSWDGELPVNPKRIAEDLLITRNGEDIPIVVRGRSSNYLDNASGQARLAEDRDGQYFLCEYNNEEISYRNRFTIAHELGHIILGHVSEYNEPKRDTNFNYRHDPVEMDANSFAATLLMPEDEVRALYRSASSIQELAEAFGVSTAAMRYRLINLGIL